MAQRYRFLSPCRRTRHVDDYPTFRQRHLDSTQERGGLSGAYGCAFDLISQPSFVRVYAGGEAAGINCVMGR